MRRDIIKTLNKLMKNSLDPHQINISINANLNVGGWLGESEPQDIIVIYSIDIERYRDEEFEIKDVIGNCVCYYINGFDYVGESFINILNVADAMSGDLLTAITPVVDDKGQLLDDYIGSNILYVDHFYIKPEFRGKGIGSLCFPMILDILGRDAGVITIIPCPTEDNGQDRIEITDRRYVKTFNEMIRFYEKFGFKKVNEEVWAQDTSLKN